MSVHVECGVVRTAGLGVHPIEVGGGLIWSETLASAGNTSNAAPAAPSAETAVVLTATAEIDVWIAIGTSPAPGTASLRRRLKAGQTRSFLAPAGVRLGWAAA